MQYNDGVDITFKFQDQEIDLAPSSYSFSVEDSIYETYPKGEFNLKDDSGLLQEMLFTVEGAKYELSLGLENDYIYNPFVVQDDILENNKTAGVVNGDVKIRLIHNFKQKQNIQSKYYKNTISNIVKEKVKDFTFNATEIDTTGNNTEWYQLLKNPVDFINDNLLPFAYSSSTRKSPFFFFIDNKNQCKFKSYKSMLDGASPIDLTLTQGTELGSSRYSILSIKRLRKGMSITYNYRHRRVFNFSENTGELQEEEDYIYSYPSTVNSLPIIANSDLVTGIFLKEDSNSNSYNKENLQGQLNFSMRDTMTLDRFLISLPFSPEISAGIPVNVIIPSSSGSDASDFNMSGIYLCEKTIHVWDGASNRANTYAVVGRKSTVLPSSEYRLKNNLINN